MEKLTKVNMQKAAPLFAQVHDSLPKSCLQGFMGECFVEDAENPQSAVIKVGDFVYLGGKANEKLLSDVFGSAEQTELYVIAPSASWQQAIENCLPGKLQTELRYAMKSQKAIFNRKKLANYAHALPNGYTLRRLCKEDVLRAQQMTWSKDHGAHFCNADEFIQKGIGFGAFFGDELAAAASSYTIYDGGVEIEIDTNRSHRGKHLAEAVAASLVLYCLENGITPCWDAANLTSAHIAQKLGFLYMGPYLTYTVTL